MTMQPPSPGTTKAGDQGLGFWAGGPVAPALLSAAEAGRRAVPAYGHSFPKLILPQRWHLPVL